MLDTLNGNTAPDEFLNKSVLLPLTPKCKLFCTGKSKYKFTLYPFVTEEGINTVVSFISALLLFLNSIVLLPEEYA